LRCNHSSTMVCAILNISISTECLIINLRDLFENWPP
jgi:hypothetical protein